MQIVQKHIQKQRIQKKMELEQEQGNQQLQVLNINQIYPWEKPHQCSYCQKLNSLTWSFTKQKMLPYTYQLLMERGWRRCGDYYYKNNMEKGCCKLWTIRQDVTQYKMKKDQKKTIKRMMALAYQCQQVVTQLSKKKTPEKNLLEKSKGKITLSVNEDMKELMLNTCIRINQGIKDQISKKMQVNGNFNFGVIDKIKYFVSAATARGDYYCNYVMLLFGVNKKLFPKQYAISDFINDMKPTIQKLGTGPDCLVEVQRSGYLVFILNQKYKKQKSNQFQIIEIDPQSMKPQLQSPKKQKNYNKSKASEKMLIQKKESEPQIVKPVYKGEITITSNQIKFGKIRIDIVPVQESIESWKIYQKYCKQVHQPKEQNKKKKKQKTMSSYIDFLCTPALIAQTKEGKNCQQMYIPSWDPTQKYQKGRIIGNGVKKRTGCFHMKYYIEDKFIAVGVVDITPSGLSSVYFFYDPDYKCHRLGVFSSLIQIEYVRYLNKVFPEFKYYYMGFYIQNNEKMSYKSDYGPCQLLCPETYQFIEFTPELKALIDKIQSNQVKSVRLTGAQIKKLYDMNFDTDIGVYINQNLKLTYQGQKLTLSQIRKEFFVPVLNILRAYIQVFGKQIFNILTFTL